MYITQNKVAIGFYADPVVPMTSGWLRVLPVCTLCAQKKNVLNLSQVGPVSSVTSAVGLGPVRRGRGVVLQCDESRCTSDWRKDRSDWLNDRSY